MYFNRYFEEVMIANVDSYFEVYNRIREQEYFKSWIIANNVLVQWFKSQRNRFIETSSSVEFKFIPRIFDFIIGNMKSKVRVKRMPDYLKAVMSEEFTCLHDCIISCIVVMLQYVHSWGQFVGDVIELIWANKTSQRWFRLKVKAQSHE